MMLLSLWNSSWNTMPILICLNPKSCIHGSVTKSTTGSTLTKRFLEIYPMSRRSSLRISVPAEIGQGWGQKHKQEQNGQQCRFPGQVPKPFGQDNLPGKPGHKKHVQKKDANALRVSAQKVQEQQLVKRKVSVVAKAVDPEKVTEALTAIYAGLIAVVATLRVRFAACVTLGTTVGDIAHGFVDANLSPVLRELTPDDYKKWVGPGVKYGCKLFGISMAWTIQRMISAYHSSVRGAQLFARGVLHYAVRRGYLQSNAIDETGRFFNIFIFVFAFVGFWNQFMTGFSLPFPLNILLIPVRMAEFGMQVAVSMLG